MFRFVVSSACSSVIAFCVVLSVPDMSIKGTLSALHGALDLSQYKLIRGLLSYNIGEVLDEFNCETSSMQLHRQAPGEGVWTLTSIHLDLLDVTLKLQLCHSPESSLACVNFIKSHLMVETYSNQSRDVDLVSQEILVTDTRFQGELQSSSYRHVCPAPVLLTHTVCVFQPPL